MKELLYFWFVGWMEKERRKGGNIFRKKQQKERTRACLKRGEEKLYWMLPSITRSSSLPPFPHATVMPSFSIQIHLQIIRQVKTRKHVGNNISRLLLLCFAPSSLDSFSFSSSFFAHTCIQSLTYRHADTFVLLLLPCPPSPTRTREYKQSAAAYQQGHFSFFRSVSLTHSRTHKILENNTN